MADLQGLSMELLLTIVSYLPQESLTALALSCKKLHHAVIPQLYSAIGIWPDTLRHEIRTEENHCLHGQGYSIVYDAVAFLLAIVTNDVLRASVKDANIQWTSEGVDGISLVVKHCLRALESSPLQNCHLSPQSFLFNPPAGLFVTSLTIEKGGKPLRDHELSEQAMSYAYALLSIASLRVFEVDFDTLRTDRMVQMYDGVTKHRPEGSSNVKIVILQQSALPEGYFREFLSWPKALRSCKILPYHWFTNTEVYEALHQQRDTLEDINIGSAQSSMRDSNKESLILKGFTALKHVAIGIESLLPFRPDYDSSDYNDLETSVDLRQGIHQSLPPTLETLSITTDSLEFILMEYSDETLKAFYTQFQTMLVGITTMKSTSFPALKTIVVSGPSAYGEDHIWNDNIQRMPFAICKREGIDLSITKPLQLPVGIE